MIGKNLSKMQECTFQWSNIQPNNRNNVPRAYPSIPSTRPGSSHRSNDTPAPGGNLWKKPLLRPSGSRNREAVSSPFDRRREEEKKRRGGRRRREGGRHEIKSRGTRGHCPPTFHPFPSRDNIDKRYLSANLPDKLSTSFLHPLWTVRPSSPSAGKLPIPLFCGRVHLGRNAKERVWRPIDNRPRRSTRYLVLGSISSGLESGDREREREIEALDNGMVINRG